MKAITYPAWFNGPNGQAAIFEAAEDVPKGWTSGAEAQTATGEAKQPAPVKQPAPTKPAASAPAKKAGRPPKKAAKAAPLDL